MSDRGGGPRLAYVRLGLDRPLPLSPGRNVIAAGPSGAAPHRVTGIERAPGGADVLEFELADPEDPSRGAPKRKRRRPDPAGTRYVVTLVRASEPLEPSRAAAVLDGWKRDGSEPRQWVGAALTAVNRAMRAHRLVQRDPYALEVTVDDLLWAVVGHASSDVLGARGVGEQIDALGARGGRQNSAQRARPGEVTGQALTGELALLEGEELVALAVREANHGRLRSAAAALAAGQRLLEEDLDRRVGGALARLPDPTVADGAAYLAAAEALQDAVDRWRSGVDADEAPEVLRAGEVAHPAPSAGSPAHRTDGLRG